MRLTTECVETRHFIKREKRKAKNDENREWPVCKAGSTRKFFSSTGDSSSQWPSFQRTTLYRGPDRPLLLRSWLARRLREGAKVEKGAECKGIDEVFFSALTRKMILVAGEILWDVHWACGSTLRAADIEGGAALWSSNRRPYPTKRERWKGRATCWRKRTSPKEKKH